MLPVPARQNASRRRVAVGAAIPAPVKGLDAASPLQNMDAAYAIKLENWFPEPGYVRLRRGHSSHSTGVGSGAVETLMAWHGATTEKLFAAADNEIYDVTSTGPASEVVNSLSNARFQHINFTTSGGNYLFAVNGADNPQAYEGSTWSEPSITGITAADAIGVNAHKNRIWLIMSGSTKAAYLGTNAIAGAATEFELGPNFTLGGYLMAMGTWTVDGGNGPDDYAVFISSRGQCAVYSGPDPSSSDTWALLGVYNMGAPIGRRCFTKVAGDLALISIDGVVPLSKAISIDRGAVQTVSITARIQREMNAAARDLKDNFGWQLIGYPKGTAAILNVPLTETQTSNQFVMNTLHGAWCKYTGMNAFCWEVYLDRLFFGGADGVVYEADIGVSDNGAAITAELKTAFNYFGQRGILKRFTMLQALLSTDGSTIPAVAVDVDYADDVPVALVSDAVVGGAIWNNIKWNQFQWSGGISAQTEWVGIDGVGQCAAVHVRVSIIPASGTEITLFINGFHILYEPSVGAFF